MTERSTLELAEQLGIDIPKSAEVRTAHEDPLKLQKERERAEHEQQAERKTIIDGATKQGLIQKTTFPVDDIWIWLSPAFSGIDYDLKHKFIGIVRDYYTISGKTKGRIVTIIDSTTGNQLGSYTRDHGLNLVR